MLDSIVFAFAIPSWEPNRVTPFQGFAPGLPFLVPLMELLPYLPADLAEFAMDPNDRLARKRTGAGLQLWSPVNVETLVRFRKPTPSQPLMLIFTADKAVAKRISSWRFNLRIKPLHVSTIKVGGTVAPAELTTERLARFCRTALEQAKLVDRDLDISEALLLINGWKPLDRMPSSLRLHSHNVVTPNQLVLMGAGEAPASGQGELKVSPRQDYIDAITESSKAVLKLQAGVEDREMYRLYPPRPDLFLLAPSMYRQIGQVFREANAQKDLKRAIRSFERQREYTMRINVDDGGLERFAPFAVVRGAELKLQTTAVGLRANSTLAATIRLPPAVNRCAGVVDQLARHMRSYDDRLPDRKTAKVFKAVQTALAEAIPAEHLALIGRSRTGIKLFGDTPLEWIPVDGLPLGIRHDVSRIPTTPGNMTMEQIRSVPPIGISPAAFNEYLLLSMFEDGDRISEHIRLALETLPGATQNGITGTRKTPKSEGEFIAALNAYRGDVLIVDGHGQHPSGTDVGGLIIGGRAIDVWTLRDRARIPPVVLLSACDTHPYDRSHASVANGFLACGAISVLGTVLPIRARDAAIFMARLLLRATQFAEIHVDRGRSVPWTNVIGGALRMQLVSDVVRGLVARNLLSEEVAREVQLKGNMVLNPHREDWFSVWSALCRETGGFDEATWGATFDDILAASDVIRYTSLGNPEAILISDGRVENSVEDAIILTRSPSRVIDVVSQLGGSSATSR